LLRQMSFIMLSVRAVSGALTRRGVRFVATLPRAEQMSTKLFKTDPKCASIAFSKFAASDPAAVDRARKGLEAKGHKVVVVDDSKGALAALLELIPASSSVYNTGSTTLEEIGFVDYLIQNPTRWNNLKAKTMGVRGKPEYAEAWKAAVACDYWIASASAISEQGDVILADATSTRIAGFASAGRAVVVASANKIAPTYKDAEARVYDYCLPLESARMRLVTNGKVSSSAVNNYLAVRGVNAQAKQPITLILVKNESLGF